jgi:hypothetical protein
MQDARIVINVSDVDYSHSNGLSGLYIVPAKKKDEAFGMLVVYNAREIQDVGGNKQTTHWPSATSVASDVLGKNSDATAHVLGARGGSEKWGILLCEANPDIPRELLQAENAQIEFLNTNRPDIKQKRDPISKMMLATTVWPPELTEQVIELSERVEKLRAKFEAECRKLVTKDEVARAKRNMQIEDQRLVSEGDTLWAGNELAKRNINELHKAACRRLGQQRPWSYIAMQLVDCPGCGANIHEDILTCPACGGWLDEGIEQLRAMKPKDRAVKMYPERYAEPAAAGRRS